MSGAAPTPPALTLRDVNFAYGQRPVLKGVSFSVPPGRFCALLGINGAGKSTLFSLITRLFVCREGEISIFGHRLREAPLQALGCLGVVFQQPTLDMDITIVQNMKYHCALTGLKYSETLPEIERILAELELGDRRGDKVRQLSGGQRRRVELARALLHRPRLLLADEPTVGLDIHSREAILRQVRQRCADDQVGVLWATHLVDEIEAEDQVVVLHQGRVLAQGTATEVMQSTGTDDIGRAFNALTGVEAA